MTNDDAQEFSGEVEIGFSDILELNFEGFLDTLAESTGHPLLMEIDYLVTGLNVDNQSLIVKVTGVIPDYQY